MQDGLAAPRQSIPCRTLRLRPLRRHASPCVHYLQTITTARVPSVLPPRGNPLGDNEHCHARGRASPVPWQRERAWQTSGRRPARGGTRSESNPRADVRPPRAHFRASRLCCRRDWPFRRPVRHPGTRTRAPGRCARSWRRRRGRPRRGPRSSGRCSPARAAVAASGSAGRETGVGHLWGRSSPDDAAPHHPVG